MKITARNEKIIFNIEDIDMNKKSLYPLNTDYDEIFGGGGTLLLCYDMNIEKEISSNEINIIEGTAEEIKIFENFIS